MDIDDEILEYFEENDWEMTDVSVEMCAQKILSEFSNEEEAVEYIQGYLNSMFNG